MTSVPNLKVKEAIRMRVMIVLLSCVLPIQIMGPGAIAVTLALAFFCFLSLPQKLNYLKHAFNAALHPVGLMVLIMAIFWVPNITLSSEPVRSFETAIRTFLFLGLAILFWAILVKNKAVHGLFCRIFIIASAVAVLIAIIAEIAVPGLYWLINFKGWLDIPIGTSQKSFAALAVFMVPALLWAGFRLSGKWIIFAVTSSIGFITLVGLTYNKAAIAGFIAMSAVAAVLVARLDRSRILRIGLPGVALTTIIGTLIWFNITHQSPRIEGNWFLPLWLVDFQRQSIWKFSFELLQQNFWFGMGINTINFAPGANAIIPGTIDNLNIIPSHPHNWILEVAVETGVFGLLSLLGAITSSFIHMIRKFLQNGDYAYLIAICMSVGYWVSGLFNFSFWSAWWQISFVLILALCLSQNSDSDSSDLEKLRFGL